MNNFGEEDTSIYLRLQGFLTLNNFVIHRTYDNESGECDILALRLRKMKESIFFKGKPDIEASFDYSNKVFDQEGLTLSKDVYLWVEVTLRNKVTKKYAEEKFSASKCKYVIERLGIQDWIDMEYLSSNPFYVDSTNDKVFAKVLVCENIPSKETNRCLYTDYDYVRKQLQDWFKKYKKIKKANWYAWIDPSLQRLAKQYTRKKDNP